VTRSHFLIQAKSNQWHLVPWYWWHSLIHGQTKPAASGDSVALSHPWPNQTCNIWCLGGTLSSMAKPNQWHLGPRWHSLIDGQTKPAASVTQWHFLIHGQTNPAASVTRWYSLIHGQTKSVASGDSNALSHHLPNQTSCTWCLGGHSLIHCQTKPAASGDSVALSHPLPNKISCICCPGGTLSSIAKLNQLHLVPRWHSLIHGQTKPASSGVTRSHFLLHGQTKPAASGAPVALPHPWPNQNSCIW
jgi:hypothetical protein